MNIQQLSDRLSVLENEEMAALKDRMAANTKRRIALEEAAARNAENPGLEDMRASLAAATAQLRAMEARIAAASQAVPPSPGAAAQAPKVTGAAVAPPAQNAPPSPDEELSL